MKDCPRCHATLETPLACSACGALVSGDAGDASDPFAVFGLGVSYAIDAGELKRRLLRFTRLVHPDFFATSGDEERRRAETASAALNSAHELLAGDAARADWIVRHLGGPDEQIERAMPREFLMEVLEWNETLEAARAAKAGTAERDSLERLRRELAARRVELFEGIARGLDPLPAQSSAKLVELRKQLNAARYIDRTLDEIGALRVAQSLSK